MSAVFFDFPYLSEIISKLKLKLSGHFKSCDERIFSYEKEMSFFNDNHQFFKFKKSNFIKKYK